MATESDRFRRELDAALAQGWRIDDETAERVVLVRPNYGDAVIHLLVAVLTIWWSMGVVNVAYGAWKYLTDSERKVLPKSTRSCPECGATADPGDAYCSQCGEELPAERNVATTCPECGAAAEAGASYCPDCGTPLAAAPE